MTEHLILQCCMYRSTILYIYIYMNIVYILAFNNDNKLVHMHHETCLLFPFLLECALCCHQLAFQFLHLFSLIIKLGQLLEKQQQLIDTET